jgi:hypothetical protein
MRKDDRCTLDPGLTALTLRGLSNLSAYPFVERPLAETGRGSVRGSHEASRPDPTTEA